MKKEHVVKGSFFYNNRNLFIKDSTGKTVYYPWGIWGKGYYVDAQQEEHVGTSTAFVFFTIFGCIGLAFLIASFFKNSFAVAFILSLIFFQGVNYFRIKKVTTGLEECETGLTTHQRIKASVHRYKLWQLIIGEGAMIYFFILTFFRPLSLGSIFPPNKIDAVFWPVLFGIVSIYYAYLLIIKLTNKK